MNVAVVEKQQFTRQEVILRDVAAVSFLEVQDVRICSFIEKILDLLDSLVLDEVVQRSLPVLIGVVEVCSSHEQSFYHHVVSLFKHVDKNGLSVCVIVIQVLAPERQEVDDPLVLQLHGRHESIDSSRIGGLLNIFLPIVVDKSQQVHLGVVDTQKHRRKVLLNICLVVVNKGSRFNQQLCSFYLAIDDGVGHCTEVMDLIQYIHHLEAVLLSSLGNVLHHRL